ncbi:MAG: hypothetical protein K0U86_06745 [Planctomycetes bacterium]|nr:hypothetical protein [Planctomycetota bacterium]MCH9724586.1 hypothetical protein [Planctomycetota bacterium]MCH9777875.1 hypothetical protein [Planctomycetota bacterium]
MGIYYVFWQVSPWLIFLMGCAALYLIMTWPIVNGKRWLVVSISLIILTEALSHLLPHIVKHSGIDEAGRMLMGPDEYSHVWKYEMILGSLSMFGKLLFVVAVFQLRTQLRKNLVCFSTDGDVR